MTTTLPLLDVRNLSIEFRSTDRIIPAVRNISFSVSQGETVAIVGESGSGKSVTALALLQLLPAPPFCSQHGQLIFSEKNRGPVDILTAEHKTLESIRGNKIAMIFQEPMTSLNPVFSCGQQIMESLQRHKKLSAAAAKKMAIEWLDNVKLPNPSVVFHRYPHQLSGGQKQRVMIAMAMCCQPSLLICDEPTTALDVTVQQTILTLIKELQEQQNMGVIFITHDLGVVAEIATRALVMYKGELVEEGSIHHIFHHAVHPYTKALLACRPGLHPRGERLPVVSDFMGNRPVTDAATHPVIADKIDDAIPLLTVEHLTVRFAARRKLFSRNPPSFTAVDDVSFNVYRGETLGLVGESGCGKTTLGRTILRLIEPATGKIIYNGRDLTATSRNNLIALRKEMQVVFQDPYSSLNPRITIGSAISEPMKVHDPHAGNQQRKQRVLELLGKVDMQAAHADRYPHEFSGGQRQRIVIARALALNPSFIVCDESVSALDVSVQAQVLNLLNELKKEFGFTVIFISHDLSVVRYISDRIMVMKEGKIIETGPADQVYFEPREEYTKKLIDSIPKAVGSIK